MIYMINNYFCKFLCIAGVAFTSKYQGTSVSALVGSSVNFSWSFTGNINTVNWGLKRAGANDLSDAGFLVSLGVVGQVSVQVPPEYVGRVSGSRSGNASSGQAIFTLTSINKNDERFFGCLLSRASPLDTNAFESVYLVVEG